MNIYVGNLAWEFTEDELRGVFEEFGEVVSAKVIIDKYNQRSRGFGFVEMANEAEAETAIAKLNEKEVKGRPLKVNQANPK